MNDQMPIRDEDGLVFFGRITASISHEVNNVLAIINELAGLLEDLLQNAEQRRPIDPQKLRSVSDRIQTHIQRGESIVKRLNRFAHSIDDPVSEFDLNVVLNDLVNIAQRFAMLKGIQLETNLPAEPVSINSSRFAFQLAVFGGIEKALATLNKDESVKISCHKQQDQITITIDAGEIGTNTEEQNDMTDLIELMKKLGGNLEITKQEGKNQSLILSFPYSIS